MAQNKKALDMLHSNTYYGINGIDVRIKNDGCDVREYSYVLYSTRPDLTLIDFNNRYITS